MQRIILLLVAIVLASFSVNEIFAETFESLDKEDNYLFLQISNEKAFGLLKIDGKIITIQENIKYYKNGNFRISAFDNKIILFGIPTTDGLKITVLDLKNREKTTVQVQKVDTVTTYEKFVKKELTVLEKFELAEEQTGLGDIRAQQLLEKVEEEKRKQEEEANKIVIPRSEYTQSTDREIAILIQTLSRVSSDSFFDFDIRIVDPSANNMYDYYNTVGFIDDVEIISIVKDGEGNTLNTFAGNTTNNGHYSPEDSTYFVDNINTRDAFTLQINATKYFDDTATFATTYLLKEFFVFIPNDNDNQKIPIPLTPLIFKVTNTGINDVTLEWNAPNENDPIVTSYIIKYTDTPSDNIENWDSQPVNAPAETYVVEGLNEDTEYSFVIIAVNNYGESSPSNIVTTTTEVRIIDDGNS